MTIKDTPKPRAASASEDPAIEPSWLGTDLSATCTKCEVVEGGTKGKQIIVGLGIRVEDSFWAHLPVWLPNAAYAHKGEQRLASCKLAQAKCRIGVTFKGLPGKDPETGDLKIEACQLQPGMTVKFSEDPSKVFPIAQVKLRIDYTQERVKFFGDRVDALVRFKAYSAKTAQNKLPLDAKSKAAGEKATREFWRDGVRYIRRPGGPWVPDPAFMPKVKAKPRARKRAKRKAKA